MSLMEYLIAATAKESRSRNPGVETLSSHISRYGQVDFRGNWAAMQISSGSGVNPSLFVAH